MCVGTYKERYKYVYVPTLCVCVCEGAGGAMLLTMGGRRGGWRICTITDMYSNDGGQGGAQGCEAYEAKKKRENYAVFYFSGKRKMFIYYL